jgi:glycosyltransferase involved in cell wall biosynthesis
MHPPTVSFVVPCYKLAHLLTQCIDSILSQTYGDLEVLIMDDCSPDNTPAVANSFQDHRVKHIRNDQNLGPLRNYNKGIGLSRGKYVWLISADDYLRRPYILQRYVELMDRNPRVGYAFCPGITVRNGQEAGVWGRSAYGSCDRIVNGHVLLKTLLGYNMILAPSAMVRRECYQNIGMFPLDVTWAGNKIDMVWGGDWYLWCLFALFYDVGYFAEPMVCYREHELSMTNTVTQERIDNCAAADIAVLWMIKQRAKAIGLQKVSRDCLYAVACEYTRHRASKQYLWLDHSSTSCMSIGQFEESLCKSTECDKERNWVRARVFAGTGDRCLFQEDLASAKRFYLHALRQDPWMTKVWAKILLLSLGKSGRYIRRRLRSFRANGVIGRAIVDHVGSGPGDV